MEAESRPGFGGDLTSWRALISKHGTVVQTVASPRRLSEVEFARIASLIRARRHSEIKPRDYFTEQQYSTELTPAQLEALRAKLGRVDFPQVAAAFSKFPVCDAPTVGVTAQVDGAEVRAMGPCGVLNLLPEYTASGLLTAEEARRDARALEAFFELWEEVRRLMPWQGQPALQTDGTAAADRVSP